MKCSYHNTVDAREACSVCRRTLCSECTHTIKGKAYCQDCLAEGTEWAATIKGLKLPSDAPKRAAFCAVIPGLGAVYNGEYTKAITYFAVFAALSVMGSRVSGIFGFGAFVFVLFTMFDAYRSAESIARKRVQQGFNPEKPASQDKTIVGWGVLLIALGLIFLLHNIISYYFSWRFLNQFWPVVFILLGGYLVYRAIQARSDKHSEGTQGSLPGSKEGI